MSSTSGASERSIGFAYTIGAFLLWGVSPVFWKLLDTVPPLEILGHRVVWCALLMAIYLVIRRGRVMGGGLRGRRRAFIMLLGSTLLIATNWYLFILSVVTDRLLQASLGYYVNPLISVVLGMVFLGERMRRLQALSVAVAVVGVAVLTARLGHLPWLSVGLALSFGFYGLLRKTVPASPEEGLTLETWLLLPAALALLVPTHLQGGGAFGTSWSMSLLLVAAGLWTAVPLLWFTHGARRLPLATVGVLQYLAPTGQFLLGVLVYREPFDSAQLVAFVLIWIALAIFTVDARRARPT
ncbi:MAG: EamA family transporter RarD [Acidobacteriota bacterium]